MNKEDYLKNIKLLPNNNIIYGLVDPHTNQIRYIGKAVDLYMRIKNHYKPSRLIDKTHKNNWINKLLSEGEYSKIHIIEKCNNQQELNDAEKKWIKYYRDLGCDLTNGTDGGDGGKMSPESIEKMRLKKIGKKLSETTKQKMSESKKGHIVSNETREKLREKRKTYIVSEETRKKQSNSHIGKVPHNKGKKLTSDHKDKISKALTGRKLSDDTRKKISEAGKKRMLRDDS
jgi:hypothetical protein